MKWICSGCGNMFGSRVHPRFCPACGKSEISALARDPEIVEEFHGKIKRLGACWSILGLLTIIAAVAGIEPVAPVDAPWMYIVGAIILLFGILIALEYSWAVYVGLALSYLGLWAQFEEAGSDSNLVAIVILIALIWQGHLVIFLSRRMHRATEARNPRKIPNDGYVALSEASKLEARGEASEALERYEEIIRTYPGTDAAKDAEKSIASLKKKIG